MLEPNFEEAGGLGIDLSFDALSKSHDPDLREENLLNENNTYASTHLHEPSPTRKTQQKKIGLVAVVMLVLILMCIGIGVPLSYYGNDNGKADFKFFVRFWL